MKRVEVFLSSSADSGRRLGTLEFDEIRGREISSLVLDDGWVADPALRFLGPDIGLFRGKQYPTLGAGFGIFQDAAPDSWGRKLIRRREKRGNLRESDYLLGAFDQTRIGALRFRMDGSASFLDAGGGDPAPPWTTLRTLESASRRFEDDETDESALQILLKPGTSLGGARPKANVTAPDGSLWIAKFPSKDDDCDVGAWEFLVHELAGRCGLRVPEAMARKFSKSGTTFLCRRFDRDGARRIPFASAMTMLGCEDGQEENNGTYLDMAGFILQHGAKPEEDLPELWRRTAFSVLVSNTDDHLRNHGFIAENGAWRLSPAYDLNANAKRPGALSLDMEDGLSVESVDDVLAAADFFRIPKTEAEAAISRMRSSVAGWRTIAASLGISRAECEEMSVCFDRG